MKLGDQFSFRPSRFRRPLSALGVVGLLIAGDAASADSPPAAKPAPAAAAPVARSFQSTNAASILKMRVAAIQMENAPLNQLVDYLRDSAELNVFVNWPALELAGVDTTTPITLDFHNVHIDKIIDLTLQQLGDDKLAWYVSDNIVYITTRELADRDLITVVYPVQDLLVDVPDFVGPSFSLESQNNNDVGTGGSSGGGGGGSSTLFGGGGGSSSGTNSSTSAGGGANTLGQNATREERGQKLVELVETIVSPEIWDTNGGPARIRYFNGCLIVTAPRSVQEQVSAH